MARDLHDILQEHQQRLRDEDPWIWLYEWQVPTDPPTRYRLTNYTEEVPFGVNSSTGEPILYLPYPVIHGGIEHSKQGDVPRTRVVVANATREIGEIIDRYRGLEGQPVVIRLVNRAGLSSGAQVRYDAEIVRARMTTAAVYMDVAAQNIIRSTVPRRRYMRNGCGYPFGGPECGYQIPSSPSNTVGGGFSICGNHHEDCAVRGLDEAARGLANRHPLRIGAFLGMGRGFRR